MLAAEYGIPRRALLGQVRTRDHLARAIAHLIVRASERQAAALYADNHGAPDDDSLGGRLTRAFWERLDAARQERERAEAEQTDALLARWRAEQGQ